VTKKATHAQPTTAPEPAQGAQAQDQEVPQAAQPSTAGTPAAVDGAGTALVDATASPSNPAPAIPNPKRGGLWRVALVGDRGPELELVGRTRQPHEVPPGDGESAITH
jgi:hypothetical protein